MELYSRTKVSRRRTLPGTRYVPETVTLNLAWISGGSVFLVSDTAATARGAARSPTTSIGQAQQRPDGYAVEESAAKVVPFGTHAAAALCGDASAGMTFALSVLQRIERGVPLDEAMLLAGHSMHQQEPPYGRFVVTIARWDCGPKIIRYDSQTLKLVDASDMPMVIEGSLRAELKSRVREKVRRLPGPPTDGQAVLAAALAVLQGLGASEDLVSDSVAGIFYGLRIDSEGLHWQPNILYVFYNNDGPAPDEPPMNLVGSRVLDGVLTVGSSLNQQVRCFVYPGNKVDAEAWMERWQGSLNARAALLDSRLIAFVRVTGGSVFLIKNDGEHFRHEYDAGQLVLGTSPALEARLRWKPTEERPFSFGLGLGTPDAT